MDQLGYNVLTPNELRVGDVVCYWKNTGDIFPDMRVVRKEEDGIYLRRPYITDAGEASYEELYWRKDSNFFFKLLRRPEWI